MLGFRAFYRKNNITSELRDLLLKKSSLSALLVTYIGGKLQNDYSTGCGTFLTFKGRPQEASEGGEGKVLLYLSRIFLSPEASEGHETPFATGESS